jgi:hypothetical protein
MIIASLVVIMVTLSLLFSNQQNERINHIREQGTSLARLISRIPIEQLVAGSGQSGALSVLQHSSADSDFAYVAIVNAQGAPLTEVTAPGVLVPGGQLPASPASWLGERDMQLPGDQRAVTEFYAPLLRQGEIAGYVRLGYLRPGFGLTASQLPLFASFALPIFLLTPLFYFLLRREVRPFREATDKLDKIVGQAGSLGQVELTPSDEMQGFMDRFNRFMGVMQHRIGELEADRSELETSTKLLGCSPSPRPSSCSTRVAWSVSPIHAWKTWWVSRSTGLLATSRRNGAVTPMWWHSCPVVCQAVSVACARIRLNMLLPRVPAGPFGSSHTRCSHPVISMKCWVRWLSSGM